MRTTTHGWTDRFRLSDPPMPGGQPHEPDPDPDPDAPPPIEEPPVPIPVPPDPGPLPQHLLYRQGGEGRVTMGRRQAVNRGATRLDPISPDRGIASTGRCVSRRARRSASRTARD